MHLVMFLDESGDHSLAHVQPEYPVFVLAGAVFELEYHSGVATERLDTMKRQLFGRPDVVLHTADLVRNRPPFERMAEPAFRKLVYERLNGLMRELDYQLVACAIREDAHLAKYAGLARDPYDLSLTCLLERFTFLLQEGGREGSLIAESRSPALDGRLAAVFEGACRHGTWFLPAAAIRRRIKGLEFRPKQSNTAGLQVADLAASPIGRAVIGKTAHEDYSVVESKLRRVRGRHEGYGLVLLPRNE